MKELFSYIKLLYRKIFKHEEYATKEAASRSGIYVENPSVQISGTARVLHAVNNAILMFTLVTGLSIYIAAAFELTVNLTFLLVVYAVLASLISLMNVRSLWQNIGYLVIFVLFTVILITFRQYINSGLNAFLNDFFDFLSDYWKLDFQKTYSEAFEDQHEATLTAFFATIGFALMILLNFVFNNEQSPLTIFVVIFPILQFAMYFDAMPGYVAAFLMMLCLLACFIYRHNFQFAMPVKKKDVRRFHAGHSHYYMHYSNGRVILQTLPAAAGLIAAIMVILSVLFPVSSFTQDEKLLTAKTNTNEPVRQVLLYGLAGLFGNGQDSGIGGLNQGSLGQNGTVYSDYQTDLTVTFAPYSYDTVYLKSYVATSYYGTAWKNVFSDDELLYGDYGFDSAEDIINYEAEHLEELSETDEKILKGRMLIDPQDLSLGAYYLAYPYYTLFDFDGGDYSTSYRSSGYSLSELTRVPYYTGDGSARDLTYYVYQNIWDSEYATAEPTSDYDRYISDNYLSIWGTDNNTALLITDSGTDIEDTHDVPASLKKFCSEHNFHGTTEEIIEQIQALFVEEYTYTLNPGKTPDSEDFVLYFLNNTKRGYCSYFATAGTLLLRTMGIPARYVEGYVVSMSDVVDADFLEDENYDDWLQGDAEIGRTAVVQADVDDSRAHAWCEVYLNGYGWVPVEFTPPSDDNDDDTNYDSLWNSINNLDGSTTTADAVAAIMNSGVGKGVVIALRIIVAALLCIVGWFAVKAVLKYIDKRRGRGGFYAGDRAAVMRTYQRLVKLFNRRRIIDTENLTITECERLISGFLSENETKEFTDIYKKAAYSENGISVEERRRFEKLAALIRKHKNRG